jgi:hypothetical protein
MRDFPPPAGRFDHVTATLPKMEVQPKQEEAAFLEFLGQIG